MSGLFKKLLPPFGTLLIALAIISCSGNRQKAEDEKTDASLEVPRFNADSAYAFIVNQVSYGPRVPNTIAHRAAGDYLISSFRKYGAQTIAQEFQATSFDGQRLALRNIIASYNPAKQKRILLTAHWDTRPFADKDLNNTNAPEGANDGASGAAILLEIARQIGSNSLPDVGVDLILFDGEDWGEKNNQPVRAQPPNGWDSWWCLGSQYWSRNKHRPGYTALYGINLDMVGGRDALFFQEGNSMVYAPEIVEKTWKMASRMGYSSIFISQEQEGITDDHLFVSDIAKIPTINIVPYDPLTGYFGDFHHTQKDNISLISKETLDVVGTLMMNLIYSED